MLCGVQQNKIELYFITKVCSMFYPMQLSVFVNFNYLEKISAERIVWLSV